MCDYSLHEVETRPSQIGDVLTTRMFNSGTRGFCASENRHVAVCLHPGTELSFTEQVRHWPKWPSIARLIKHRTAIFRKVNKENPIGHRDALEFPDGEIVLLTNLEEGQQATVLQLPPSVLNFGALQTPRFNAAKAEKCPALSRVRVRSDFGD